MERSYFNLYKQLYIKMKVDHIDHDVVKDIINPQKAFF